MKLLIIADDLTGALDTAVQVSKRGVKTIVSAWAEAETEPCEALCINLDMRHDTPNEAFCKTVKLLGRYPDVAHIYLKTDSALRGNLSAAFMALLKVYGKSVMFIPAYPKAGRVTIGGEQYIGGVGLGDSSFAHDPLNPMTTGNIREILNASHNVLCKLVPDGEETSFSENTEAHIAVFDCQTQAAMALIGERLKDSGNLHLTAGCAGFAEILCDYITFEHEHTQFIPHSSPVLFLSGSANKATFEQLAHARQSGLEIVKIPTEMKFTGLSGSQENLPQIWIRLNKSLAAGQSIILATAENYDDLTELPAERHSDIQQIFAQTARHFADKNHNNFAIFGGDTALAILRGLNLPCVRPLCEIQSGVPLCASGHLNIATKSGGLGEIDVVAAIEAYMRGQLSVDSV